MSRYNASMPFDPNWEFEDLVLRLNQIYWPGSMSSGRARNELMRAWALCAGRERAQREVEAAVARHGSRNQLLQVLRIARASLVEYEAFLATIPERPAFPTDAPGLRTAFEALAAEGQLAFLKVAAELLQNPDLLGRLAEPETGQLTVLVASALRAFDLRIAVDELAALLDGGEVLERVYQDWCDRHSWAFGNAHVLRDDVRRLDDGNIVDMLLPDLVGFRDIIELKRPDEELLCWDRSHRSYYFSSQTSKAIGQVHKYIDKLHDVARDGLAGHPHIVAYHPHARIVIGRSHDWELEKTRALRGLNERLHGVSVMTYDHLLGSARQLLATIGVIGPRDLPSEPTRTEAAAAEESPEATRAEVE
jgi:hypothetical protein